MFGKIIGWIDDRIPMTRVWNMHIAQYPAPKNFNFWYFFGSLAMLVLVNQILTGIWLTMNFVPSSEGAFASVEYIMRDVEYGWLLRYLHSTGASAFFIVVYMHMFRGMIYGSYQKPRELLWLFGMFIFLALMAEAFMGYLLPWGQMSFWGAQVIISLFGAIPVIGDDLTLWIRGDYVISGATLNRFFALHVIALPLVIVILVFLHIVALHEVGSNNPDGVEIKRKKGSVAEEDKPKFKFHEYYTDKKDIVDAIPFHPYYTVKDIVGVVGFLILFCWVVFFMPAMNGFFLEGPNFEAANPLKTPAHIFPVWYFTPFYAILRAIPDKLIGVAAMGASIVVLALLPWLDRGTVKSVRYRCGFHKWNIAGFVVTFVLLGWVGATPQTDFKTIVSQICTVTYFMFFVLLFVYSKNEKTKPLPERLTK
ncbi:MAG: ubiquinol-cytochrome c reductase cytochrome b subunit [Pseudoalteromonas rhizosphaerae]|jgi:ubiquinol-cytochrome c reductase cytochrome b subunit|uniref:Cytochrome b n=1 Tax=Pseudoalteromonas neustonica TaxID=1840331 RepID=A0ABY3FFJ4_9GAMM|nr:MULTISPECIES: cytochrome b N-terminal domain-containing protein [Pseudoalteromonas]MBB1301785.1 cytochrome b N-terminal domain-containing protein [Pseudoalteromonas sp. SR44-8]MBB1310060.1 cytochrome b N-terminal domain-containing protein [Pseudoalteromonas sp. SR41-8]MBB1398237.1 cytochrome b N-terminal domain-containing protein [Pseudoalteromonas sp. SG44-8]MBB1410688.1 cytochrome b N-terminal domain-containing protein [Pseudoalteromonas sp. SG44-17]MBB1505501.1 cytochrome b N-terminal do|eukprot:GDKH01009447.1.p1 GENE.GDKH01009447.1~~GDKH01009447.1.p1  ORF type:complete len:422 (-),score=56.96 GDKH01009447.1:21-1286(-)